MAISELVKLHRLDDGRSEWQFLSVPGVAPSAAEIQAAVEKLQAQGVKLGGMAAAIKAAHPKWQGGLTDAAIRDAVKAVVAAAVARRALTYEIRDASDGKGMGVFALRGYKAGERIMCERPLVRWSSHEEHVRPADLKKLVSALPNDEQKAFYALSSTPAHGHAEAIAAGMTDLPGRIWMANAYPAREIMSDRAPAFSSAVYAHVCRINHACNPNCIHTWNERLQRMTVHATRAIAAGDELFLTYLGTDRDAPGRVERQALLRNHFCFNCACSLCALPEEHSRASDERRARLVALCELLHEERPGGGGTRNYKQLAKLLDEKLALMRDENVSEAWAHGAMFVAMIKAKECGSRAAFRNWAERAKKAAEIAMGADSVYYQAYAEHAQQ